jgi:hypothetical protein
MIFGREIAWLAKILNHRIHVAAVGETLTPADYEKITCLRKKASTAW